MDDMNKNGGGQDDIKIWNNPKSNRGSRRRNVYVVTTEGEASQAADKTSENEKSYDGYTSQLSEGADSPAQEDSGTWGAFVSPDSEKAAGESPAEGDNGSDDHASDWGMSGFSKASRDRAKQESEEAAKKASKEAEQEVSDHEAGKKGGKTSKEKSPKEKTPKEKTPKEKINFPGRKKTKQKGQDAGGDGSASAASGQTEKENLLGKDNLSKSERRNIWQKNTLEGTEREPFGVRFAEFLHRFGFKLIAVIVIFAIVIGASLLYNRNRTYSKAEVMWQVSASVNKGTTYYLLGNRILCCSQNGISCIDQSGSTLWNRTYDMDVPTLVIKGDYAIVYDMKGNSFYIMNGDGCTGYSETTKPILKADISASGVAAVVLDDTNCNYIVYYDKDGKSIEIEIKTLINGDGYPLDIAVSDDGTELMTSYVYSDNGTMKNQIVIRNFELGKNETNRVVGIFKTYEETLIPDVFFFDDQNAVAITESTLDFYSTRNARQPSLAKSQTLSNKIKTVFYNDSYIGVITNPGNGAEPETSSVTEAPATDETLAETGVSSYYVMTVYDKTGNKVFDTKIGFEYTVADFSGDGLVVYNNTQCAVYNMTGVCKYQTDTDFSEIAGLLRIDETTLVLYGNEALRMLKLK